MLSVEMCSSTQSTPWSSTQLLQRPQHGGLGKAEEGHTPAGPCPGPWLTFFGRQKPGTCSPLLSFPMNRISLCSSSMRASWLPASSFCETPGKSKENIRVQVKPSQDAFKIVQQREGRVWAGV